MESIFPYGGWTNSNKIWHISWKAVCSSSSRYSFSAQRTRGIWSPWYAIRTLRRRWSYAKNCSVGKRGPRQRILSFVREKTWIVLVRGLLLLGIHYKILHPKVHIFFSFSQESNLRAPQCWMRRRPYKKQWRVCKRRRKRSLWWPESVQRSSFWQ